MTPDPIFYGPKPPHDTTGDNQPMTPGDPERDGGGAGEVDYRISAEELEMIGRGGDWAQTMAIRMAHRIRVSEAEVRALLAERDALKAAAGEAARERDGLRRALNILYAHQHHDNPACDCGSCESIRIARAALDRPAAEGKS